MRGHVIDARFVIERVVGEGGMGVVYYATDLAAGTPVAFKVLADVTAANRSRFEREVALLSELAHPGIVRYIAHGTLPSGEAYLAMEWVEGESLAERLTVRGLDIRETLELAMRVAEALANAHRRGVVHRDIKPANLLLPEGRVDRVKLIDFGIARRVRDPQKLTLAGQVVGSPGYLAPEQAIGAAHIDARADMFSLGCVIYECLTGRAAFPAVQAYAMLAMVLVADPDPLVIYCPEVPLAFEELIDRMLDKVADQRPRDAEELLGELAKLGAMPDGPKRPRSMDVSCTQISDEEPAVVAEPTGPTDFVIIAASIDRGAGEIEKPCPDGKLTPALLALVEQHGARMEPLIDGSLLAIINTSVEDAERAARLALALRAVLPEAPMLLASAGPGERLADVIDRNARALEREELAVLLGGRQSPSERDLHARRAIRLHAAVADMLDERFEVAASSAGKHLLRERAAS